VPLEERYCDCRGATGISTDIGQLEFLGCIWMRILSLAFPKRFASFLLRLFSSDSNVLELAIIHLQKLSPLAASLTA
jgi:hypothetical protein